MKNNLLETLKRELKINGFDSLESLGESLDRLYVALSDASQEELDSLNMAITLTRILEEGLLSDTD